MSKKGNYELTGETRYPVNYDNPALHFLDKLTEKNGDTRRKLLGNIEYCIGKHAFDRPKPMNCDMHKIFESKHNQFRFTTGKFTVIYYIEGTDSSPSIRIHDIWIKGNKSHNNYGRN